MNLGVRNIKKKHFFSPLSFGLRMVRMESLQVLKLIFESIWGSKFDFRHQKKKQKHKLSNAFKALQNESLNVLNQFLVTIYEYKSYFCIFTFFTFCSYFPGIPRRSHCVSPLCLPVVFPRFWVEYQESTYKKWKMKRCKTKICIHRLLPKIGLKHSAIHFEELKMH